MLGRKATVLVGLMGLALLSGTARAGSGDVNGDGSVTRADAGAALRIAGGLTNPTFGQLAAASVVGDNPVTIADALRILRTATKLDPALPTGAMGTSFPLVVSANATRNVALPGGYVVTGRVTNRSGRVFTGRVAFRETTSGASYGQFPLDEFGDYVAVLPSGTYQALAITVDLSNSGSGEGTTAETATPVGTAFTVTGNQTNRNFNRPDLATPYTVTFSYTGPSQPDLTTSRITLWDTATGSPTYGQNFYESEIISAPASRQVPRGIYYIDVVSGYPLSSGLFQNFYMYFYAPVDATHTTSRTLTFPTLWELDGDFTGAAALNAVDVYAEQVPTTGLDVAGAYVQTQGISYLLAMPRGALTLSVGLATAYVETMAERLLTYTMPAAHTRKDINLPALPDFRTITGTVVGPNGQPVSGATVAADSAPQTITSTGIYAYHARTTTDTDGTYTMHLPNGTYTVNVTP